MWRRVSVMCQLYIHHHLLICTIREAQIFFYAGKNRDGYFDANDLL